MGRTKKLYEDTYRREREATYNHITNTQIRLYPDVLEAIFTNWKRDINEDNRTK